MNQSEANDKKPMNTEAAWDRLQKQLELEPVNSQWVRWSKQANEKSTTSIELTSIGTTASHGFSLFNESSIHEPESSRMTSALEEIKPRKNRFAVNWMKMNRKWLSGIAVASVLAITLFTPVGNQALAAILGKFRMEQVTVVQENDVRQIMNGFFSDGQTRDAVNKFGSFTQTSGTLNGEYSLQDAEKLMNHKIIVPKDIDLEKNKLYISPSSEITFNLHVDEVNKALQRLGAKKLLPQSIDGKPIKLIFGETVSISQQLDQNGLNCYYSLSQMVAPAVSVDPSIPVEEALAAVLDFPFLPENLKNDIKSSGALTGGSIPLPIIADGTTEKRTLKGIDVIMSIQTYKRTAENGDVVESPHYNLTWVKNGQLFNLNGNSFTDQAAAFTLVEELISQ
jgi:hypothetical protein